MKIHKAINGATLAALTLLPVFLAKPASAAFKCGYVNSAAGETVSSKHYPQGALVPCSTNGLSSIGDIVLNLTRWVLGFGGAIAILFIIWGGLQYVTAAGNEKQADAAKQTLTYAVIGLIVILLSTVIVVLVGNTIQGVQNVVT